ncbi:MAG: zinc ribbon domain-containing protein [Bacteroidota bacterium]
MTHCLNCSTELLPFSRFCHNCGHPVEQAVAPEPPESPKEESSEELVEEPEALEILEEAPEEHLAEANENEKPEEIEEADPIELTLDEVEDLSVQEETTEYPEAIQKDIEQAEDQQFEATGPVLIDDQGPQEEAENVPEKGLPELAKQLEQAFLDYFARYLDDLGQSERLPDYLSNLKASGFYSSLEPVLEQQAARLKEDGFIEVPSLNSPMYIKLRRKWLSLVEKLLIDYIAAYNAYELPASILYYQEASAQDVNLPQMIRDYLGLQQENELIYTDFTGLEDDKKQKARKRFLKASEQEAVHLLCDQSMFGNMKEGYAFTSRGFYWKPHFHPTYQTAYQQIESVELKDWLLLNGHYFHSSKRMNTKLFLLLKKLQVLFAS